MKKSDHKNIWHEILSMPELKYDLLNKHVANIARKSTFIDIETSLIEGYMFRSGNQFIPAANMKGTTKLLTAAWGTLYDMLEEGEGGMLYFGNHHSSTFKKDPLNDVELLEHIWHVLDESDVIIAHNARFDRGWIMGRFLELGWMLPSKFSVICTLQMLNGFNLSSKKLDELAQTLIGSRKLETTTDLWIRCNNGDRKAFEKMQDYNIGDIYDTLFKMYLRIAQYNPDYGIDMTDRTKDYPQCKVTGDRLEVVGEWYNRSNGNSYEVYLNPNNGIQYRNRYMIPSTNRYRKSAKMYQYLLKHHV